MKKSEMIQIIAEAIADYHIENTVEHPDENLASTLLDRIQKEGMKPPSRLSKTWADLDIPIYGEDEKAPSFYVSKWEEE